MRNCFRVLCLLLVVIGVKLRLEAQFSGAHHYDDSPVGLNQLELAYAYGRSNASIDTSLIITGAHLNLNEGSVAYTRYFSLLHRLFWAEAAVPIAGLSGSVDGTRVQESKTGAGDSGYELAMLLKGPALSAEQFENYKPGTVVGLSLTVSAPTGSYDPGTILNLGSDRWSFKPEIAVSHPFGPDKRAQLDAYGQIYFFTDNTSYHGKEILRQEPLPGLEAHFSYSFFDRLWASLDGLYAFRGTTFVDGVDQNNAQKNFVIGSEVNLALNDKNSLVFQFGKALVHENGPSLTGFTVKYDYSWAKRSR
jgi:hypothetical protein